MDSSLVKDTFKKYSSTSFELHTNQSYLIKINIINETFKIKHSVLSSIWLFHISNEITLMDYLKTILCKFIPIESLIFVH